jgi:putative oxidoreductase
VTAWVSTIIEILGGLAILAGAFVAAVSVPLIVMMLVAMFTVHLRYGFSAINTIGLTADGPQFGPPGYEVNLLYIAGLLALILGGAGPLSIDRLLAQPEEAHSFLIAISSLRRSWLLSLMRRMCCWSSLDKVLPF